MSRLDTVKLGTTMFVYYRASKNTYQVTINTVTLSTSEAQQVVEFSLNIRLVDERSHILIMTWN